MKTTAIIQARMGSTRLSGKVLMPLAGRPALWHVVERLRCCTRIDQVVVATSVDPRDDVIEEFCQMQGVGVFRGSEEDVLDRYYRAACQFRADPIVRITADCPVIDPDIVDEVVTCFAGGAWDVYGLSGAFPDGLDCVAFSFSALKEAWERAELPSEREHIGPYFDRHSDRFKCGGYEKFNDLGHLRWTLDEESDYQLLVAIHEHLFCEGSFFRYRDILDLLVKRPDLMEINNRITRNEGLLKSLEEDKLYLQERNSSHAED